MSNFLSVRASCCFMSRNCRPFHVSLSGSERTMKYGASFDEHIVCMELGLRAERKLAFASLRVVVARNKVVQCTAVA